MGALLYLSILTLNLPVFTITLFMQ
uniref:Uncharacterized protein n=1 Tax=Anguilla anguilla TaxID=7936 RepID=A0A0E9PRR7_ANGAN